MSDNLKLPIIVGQTGYYLREIGPTDGAAYQRIYEQMKSAGQYYALLWNLEKPNQSDIVTDTVGEQFVQKAINSRQGLPRTAFRLAISEASGLVLGSVVILLDSEHSESFSQPGFEIGYFISPEFQGRKIATAAIKALIKAAIEDLGLTMFWGTAHPDNLVSLRIFQKLGMSFVKETISTEDLRTPERLLFVGHEAPID
jgi:RimJ/RimL family protein N-acetyltransferase